MARGKEMKRVLEREEQPMKKVLAVLVSIVVLSLCLPAQAFDGPPPDGRSGQLPVDKEMLFQQTMKSVGETTEKIREQIRGLEGEITDVLVASEFDDVLFLEKTTSLQELQGMIREAMDEAIADLAKQFTAEERRVLAERISHRPGPPGPPPPHREP
jgi:uncharacterized membrane protein